MYSNHNTTRLASPSWACRSITIRYSNFRPGTRSFTISFSIVVLLWKRNTGRTPKHLAYLSAGLLQRDTFPADMHAMANADWQWRKLGGAWSLVQRLRSGPDRVVLPLFILVVGWMF